LLLHICTNIFYIFLVNWLGGFFFDNKYLLIINIIIS